MRLTEAMRKKQCCYAEARGDGRLAECTTSLQPVRDWLDVMCKAVWCATLCRHCSGRRRGVCEGVELGLDGVVGGDAEKVQSGGTLLTTHAS